MFIGQLNASETEKRSLKSQYWTREDCNLYALSIHRQGEKIHSEGNSVRGVKLLQRARSLFKQVRKASSIIPI